jgi:hypothetical protein
MSTPKMVAALHQASMLQVQIDTVERCYWLIHDRVTVFDAGRILVRMKSELEQKLHDARHVVDTEAPTKVDRKVIGQ